MSSLKTSLSYFKGLELSMLSFDEVADMHDHQMDALRYAMLALVKQQADEEEQIKAAMVAAGIPLPDPSWSIEQQKAHLELHCPPNFKVTTIPRRGGFTTTFASSNPPSDKVLRFRRYRPPG